MIKNLKLKVGKSYQVFDPHGYGQKKERIHVESIIHHKGDNRITSSVIIYRIWLKHKRYWKYYAEPYYVFAMWNGWEREL